MISNIRGVLHKKGTDRVVVDVQGVGYELYVPAISLERLPDTGSEVSLHTYLYVREDTMQLFGFLNEDEKGLFETLIGISGIGPRIAVSIMSVFPVDSFRKAVASTDVDAITRIPGIGQKGAKRIILELQEKLVTTEEAGVAQDLPSEQAQILKEAKQALVGLGYTMAEATRAIEDYPLDGDAASQVEDIIKYGLKNLAQV